MNLTFRQQNIIIHKSAEVLGQWLVVVHKVFTKELQKLHRTGLLR